MTSHGGKRAGAGRPRGSTAISAELREAAQKHTNDALTILVEVMQDTEHPQRVKAAGLILTRGHGAPREVPATADIINRFVAGEISAITACLMIEAEGLKVPELITRYFNNEMSRADFVQFDIDNMFPSKPPALLPKQQADLLTPEPVKT